MLPGARPKLNQTLCVESRELGSACTRSRISVMINNCNLKVAPGILWSKIVARFQRTLEGAFQAPRRRWVEGKDMKKSTFCKILFSFLAIVAVACAPNPAFAQRGGHGGGGGGGFHGGGGGGFHGGGGGGHF